MPHFERHVFVCTNLRPETNPKGCCAAKDGQIIRDTMKKKAAAMGLHGLVRVNNAGCLDSCERGVVMVVYPEQVWYGQVTVDDLDEILSSHIIGGKVVERLALDRTPNDVNTPLLSITPKELCS